MHDIYKKVYDIAKSIHDFANTNSRASYIIYLKLFIKVAQTTERRKK